MRMLIHVQKNTRTHKCVCVHTHASLVIIHRCTSCTQPTTCPYPPHTLLQTFKTLHVLRLKLRGIDRGMVVQLEENKTMIEDREVAGLRYNVYLETLPAARAQQQGQQ